jgi:putative intracellular protease/amidase
VLPHPALTSRQANSNFSQAFVPTHSFKHPPKHLDVLIVPGGLGTRAESQGLADAIKYIKDVYPSLKYIMSVCTGATLLGRAGVLDNRRATTNKQTWAFATSYGKNVSWSPTERWVVDGALRPSSGMLPR